MPTPQERAHECKPCKINHSTGLYMKPHCADHNCLIGPQEQQVCVKCHHNAGVSGHGICKYSDCLCECEFPPAPQLVGEGKIVSGGEELSISEIMQRFRNDGSCERLIRDALARVSVSPQQEQKRERPSPPDAWQPISSAPKDGRTLLLGYLNLSGKWRTVRGQWFTDDQIAEWDNADDFEADWYETSENDDEPPNCWLISPTHWTKLPAPPSAKPDQD